jgi:hypothetical protein
MADANPKVMEMIESELKKDPDISNKILFEKASKMDEGVASLSPRQFNAMYPLQVKRALKPRKPRKKKKAKASQPRGSKGAGRSSAGRRTGSGGGDERDRVRLVLLELAKDIASADGKADVVDVVAGIDRYVDRVVAR